MMKMAESRITISSRPSSPSALSRVPTLRLVAGQLVDHLFDLLGQGALSLVSGAR